MALETGYLVIDRKMTDWKYFDNLTALGLWLQLLLKANWKEGNFRGIKVPRGSLVTSIKGMAEEFGVTRVTVQKYINLFEKDGMITTKKTNKYTLINVINYDKYQGREKQTIQQSIQQDIHQGIQQGMHQGIHQGIHNRIQKIQNNTENTEKNIYTSSPTRQSEEWFEEFWEAYPKKVEKKKTRIKFLQIIKTEQQFRELMNGLKVTVVAKYQAENELRYILNPLTFLNGERWNDEPYQAEKPKQQANVKIEMPQYMVDQKNGTLVTHPATPETLAKLKELQDKMEAQDKQREQEEAERKRKEQEFVSSEYIARTRRI